ncbi:LysE family translocator [Leifsonia sp. NPDC058292]|uniref:LysE family translocator n=1 Tax=Leifsonia sp. NPDC058292 TaxID=3346428 RepID=UPI0036DDB37D
MAASLIFAFWGVSLLAVLTPGADWAYAIAGGLRARVAPAVGGLVVGHVLLTLLVAAGVGALVASVPVVLTIITIAGALYLIWLGVLTLLSPPVLSAARSEERGSWFRWASKGAGVSGLNPKVLLLFLALLPQFTARGAGWPIALQIAVLGFVHVLNCAAIYTGVGAAARVLLRSRPTAILLVSRVSGVVLIVIGGILLTEKLLTVAWR